MLFIQKDREISVICLPIAGITTACMKQFFQPMDAVKWDEMVFEAFHSTK